jgi:hypothetical protein
MANPLVILDELDKAQALGKTSGGFSPPTGAAHGRLLTSGTKRKWVRHLRVPLVSSHLHEIDLARRRIEQCSERNISLYEGS